MLRTPGGIEVLAEEDGWAVEDGYRLALLGPHDADVGTLFAQLRGMVRDAISQQYLERSAHRDGWIMRGMDVEGRLVWTEDRHGYDVVDDGRRLSWQEFGAALTIRGLDIPSVGPRYRRRALDTAVRRPARAVGPAIATWRRHGGQRIVYERTIDCAVIGLAGDYGTSRLVLGLRLPTAACTILP